MRDERESVSRIASKRYLEMTISDLVGILYRRHGVFAVSFVALLMMASVAISFFSPVYKSFASVGFVREEPATTQTDFPKAVWPNAAEFVETRMEMIVGNETLSTVMSILRGQGIIFSQEANARGNFLRRIFGDDQGFIASDAKVSDEIDKDVEALRRRIDVERIGNSTVIQIGVTDDDPERAYQIVSAVAESFVWLRNNELRRGMDNQLTVIQRQLDDARERLETVEQRHADWEKSSGNIADRERELILERIYDLNAELDTAFQEKEAARMLFEKRQAVKSSEELLALPDIAKDDQVRDLQVKYEVLQQNYAELEQRYQPAHPSMVRITGEIWSVQQTLAKALERSARQIDFGNANAQARYELVLKQLVRWKKELVKKHEALAGQGVLERDVEEAKRTVELLGAREQEILSSIAELKPDTLLLQLPSVPLYPEFPGKNDLWIAGVLVTLLVSVLIVILRDYFDQAIRSDEDLKRVFLLPVLGRVPLSRDDSQYLEIGETTEEALGHLIVLTEMMRTDPDPRQPDAGKAQVICVGSASPNEGKSRLSAQLALSYARRGFKTLLLDGDLRRPGHLSSIAGIPEFSDVLIGEEDISVLVSKVTKVDRNLDYLGARDGLPSVLATQLIETRFGAVTEMMCSSYDRIVIDTPPVLMVADSVTLMRLADVRLMVVRNNFSRRPDVMRALDQFEIAECSPDGLVLMAADTPKTYGYRTDTVWGT